MDAPDTNPEQEVNTELQTLPIEASKNEIPKPQPTFGSIVKKLIMDIWRTPSDKMLEKLRRKTLERDLKEKEKKYTKNDCVDFSRIQIEKILDARNSGKQIEYEAFSPYLTDYDAETGEIWEDKLTEEDEIGLQLTKMFKDMLPNARMISLYDEYNNDHPAEFNQDTSDPRYGVPIEGKGREFSEEAKTNFRNNIIELLRKRGIISENFVEEKNFRLISESSKQTDANELVENLEKLGYIERVEENRTDEQTGEKIRKGLYFVNNEAENPLFKRILLRTEHGKWMCEALDASSFLNPENQEITHIVVLQNDFKDQQDKTWEILRVLGIAQPETYHNIFYDKKADPKVIVDTIKEEFAKYEHN